MSKINWQIALRIIDLKNIEKEIKIWLKEKLCNVKRSCCWYQLAKAVCTKWKKIGYKIEQRMLTLSVRKRC